MTFRGFLWLSVALFGSLCKFLGSYVALLYSFVLFVAFCVVLRFTTYVDFTPKITLSNFLSINSNSLENLEKSPQASTL